MSENSLSIYGQFDQIQKAGIALYKSGYFKDSTSEAQAIVKVMAGAELGLPPFASMAGISVIQGKPVIGANLIATLIKNDPRYDYQIKQSDAKACVIEFMEHGKKRGETGFTIEEANTAGLTSKDNWKKYPSDMLFARAISRGARRFAPGIFGGSPVYTPDEMGADTDEEGFIISEPERKQQPTSKKADTDKAMQEIGFEPVAEGVFEDAEPTGEQPKKDYPSNFVGIGKNGNKYPNGWLSPLMSKFVAMKKVANALELDGILVKLALDYETPAPDVVAAVEKYLAEK